MRYGKKPIDSGLGIRPNLLKWRRKPPEMAFNAETVMQARAWQRRARQQFEACLADAPPSVALRPNVLERKQMDGYERTTLLLNTARGIRALCWLCVPDGISSRKPSPAMIATPGHGMGAKDLLGMDERGRPRKEGEGYQKDYALQVVRLGFPCLVIEPVGFGERRDPEMMANTTIESGCHAAFSIALMIGTTLARLRVNDISRGLDYLETVPCVDAKRVGLMGISGGGQMTLWTAAAETRLKLAVVSGYMNRFADSVLGMNHCICNFIPGVAKHFDMPDLAGLIAPRPILIEGGTTDPIFPVRATRSAVRRVREIYRVFGAEERVESEIFEGEHQWSGRKLARFLGKWL